MRACYSRSLPGKSHLKVTPLEERIRTLCLFFLMPLLGASAFDPLDLEMDLYTAAIVCRECVVSSGCLCEILWCSSEQLDLICDDGGRFPNFLVGVDFLRCDKLRSWLIGGWRRDTARHMLER